MIYKMKKILIIEDDEKIADFIEMELMHEGYDVSISHDGRSGFERVESEEFDLILLDLMLPGISGIEVCRRIRLKSQIPIIMVTAKDDVTDKVMGLDTGADDYITKPFAIEELLARIRVAIKRNNAMNQPLNPIIKHGNLTIDQDKCEVKYGNELIEFTRKEYLLLLYLMQNQDKVLSRDMILNKVWGFDFYGDTNIVDVYVSYIRSKIDQKYGIELVKTVRGVGFIIKKQENNI